MHHERKMPEHQAVYEKLRDCLVLGSFAPGEPLTIQKLTNFLEAGMTPVREAMRRLIAENVLQILDNRRVIVPVLTRSQMEDIYFMRLNIESELTRRACKSFKKQYITELSCMDVEVDRAIERGDVEAYLESNKAFHFYLYEAAESPILLNVVESLWAQIGPSLRVVSGRYGTANLPDKHSDLIAALSKNDELAAVEALKADLSQGLLLASQSLPQ